MQIDKQKTRLVAGTAALMLCVSGCAGAESLNATQAAQIPTQPATVHTGAYGTVPSPTAPMTEPTVPEETKSVISESTDATQSETATKPEPVTDPLSADQAQSVLQQTVSLLRSQLPDCQYDPSWNDGTQVPLPVDPNLSPDKMANTLVEKLKEMFEYQSVTCIYNLSYAGIADDGINHKFVFSYIFERPDIPDTDFDSQLVVSRVTQNVLDSDLGVSLFDGSEAKETISLTDVPLFYTTDRSVECLTDTILWKIQSKNLVKPVYTQFKLAFVSAGESSYEFVLYLK